MLPIYLISSEYTWLSAHADVNLGITVMTRRGLRARTSEQAALSVLKLGKQVNGLALLTMPVYGANPAQLESLQVPSEHQVSKRT